MRASARAAALGAAMSAYVSMTRAGLASYCPQDGLCFQWGVPEAAAGPGNLYLQLQAPTSYQWVALGTGSSMRGSSMFVVYQSGNGNVTLSTRSGQGHVMPRYMARPEVELLEGSGVVNGSIVANVRCSGCPDARLDGSAPWISAWKRGSSLDSTSASAPISRHDQFAGFAVDFGQATISSDSNPFLSPAGRLGPASSSRHGVVVHHGDSDSDSDSDDSGVLRSAHGIIMALVFVAGYPLGAALMPLIGSWIIHAGWQMFVFLGMWTGFGLGYIVSSRADSFFQEYHTRIGVFVTALMGIQPLLGWLHHQHFLKSQSRGLVSHVHIWYGRGLMIIGIVNGGLGLQCANASSRFIVAYSVVAGIVFVLYLASVGAGLFESKKQFGEKSVEMSPALEEMAQQQHPA